MQSFQLVLVSMCLPLQALKQQTDALWLEVEPRYAQLSRPPHLMTRDDLSEVEREREQLSQRWRGQQMCLHSRYTAAPRWNKSTVC